jgi:hypothetical protein
MSASQLSVHDHIVARVIGMCHQRGYLVHACYAARFCTGRGSPDLVIVGKTGVLFAEVKVDVFSKTSTEQVTWMHALFAAGADYYLWREADLEDGTIEHELDRIAA